MHLLYFRSQRKGLIMVVHTITFTEYKSNILSGVKKLCIGVSSVGCE